MSDNELNDNIEKTNEDSVAQQEGSAATEATQYAQPQQPQQVQTTQNINPQMQQYPPQYYQQYQVPPKRSKAPIIVLSIIAALALIFVAFQSVFIFLLTSGRLEKDSISIKDVVTKTSTKKEDEETSDRVNPHFSIAEAAAVKDPSKQTLSTVEIYNKCSPATVSIYLQDSKSNLGYESAGSGFFISKDGYIVTNEHVVADAKDGIIIKVYVQGYDEPFDAEVVGKDVQTDIAVIKIDGDEDFVTAELGDSDNLQSGELAVAIGNPLGTFQGSITVGVVSGIERPMNNNGYSMNLIQTDASVNGGNSGGPLINSFGEVIGVVNAKIATAEGMGFAIPINPIKSVIESLVVNGKVIDRPYLGITVKYIPKDSYFGSKEGVVVAEVEPGGPGEQAGFKNGDRIVSMDGVEIKVSNDIIGVRDSHACGDEIEVVVERDGKEVTLNMTIGDSADYEE